MNDSPEIPPSSAPDRSEADRATADTRPISPQRPQGGRPDSSGQSGGQDTPTVNLPDQPTRPIRPTSTRVERARRPDASRSRTARFRPTYPESGPTPRPEPATHPSRTGRKRNGRWADVGRWMVRGALFAVLAVVLVSFLGIILSVVGYYYIAAQLPSPEELQQRSFTFASSQIYDRDGRLMWELMDPTAGRRTWVPLDHVAPVLRQATIATEDRYFYANVGVDPIAITRAVYYNLSEGEIVTGASTITQQLARNILLSPEERSQQTMTRKIREAVLAVELFRRYPKDTILEIYLNQVYYGNLAYGIEAASQTYFGKPATELDLAEAALLAGLPQSPAIYDPFANPERAKARQRIVLNLMLEAGYITPAQAVAAFQEELVYSPPLFQFEAPHFITYIRQLIEARYGPDLLYQQPGIRVQTTLDPDIQAIAEEEVVRQIEALEGQNATNAAVVVLNTKTGEILAMVGSKDFNDEAIDGQVNVALRPRQPGSAIKPLTYLAAFEHGWTPSTLIMDVPTTYPDGAGGTYEPTNYDGKFRGPVLVRQALGSSLNITALKTLEFVGIPALKEMALRLGITTLTGENYGLSLTLGGGEVTLLELTGAYQAIANDGLKVPPVAILKVTDGLGYVIEEYFPPQGNYVLRSEHAYLMTNILADNEARAPVFGLDSPLLLSRPAAVKTGTTNEYRDSWAVGYTPDIVVGVWVGNSDNSKMSLVSGVSGAAPIWHNVMERSLSGVPVRDFLRPSTIVEMEICSDSGTLPSPVCPNRRIELFSQDQPPPGPEHDIHQLLPIDTRGYCLANANAPADEVEERYFQVYPPDGVAWALEHGIEQPPGPCPDTLGVGEAHIAWPEEGQSVEGVISIQGVAVAGNFSHYVMEYGVSWSPEALGPLAGPIYTPVEGSALADWDTRQQPNGPYVLQLTVFDQAGTSHVHRVGILVDNPLPAPTETPVPESPKETPTPVLATATPAPVPTIVTEVPTPILPTPVPSLTAPPPATQTPTLTPEPTPSPLASPTATTAPPTSTATLTPMPTDTPPPEPTPTLVEGEIPLEPIN